MKRCIIAIIVCATLCFVPVVQAKDVDLTIEPRAVGVLARPGSTVRIPLTVTNSSSSQYLKPIILRSQVSDDGLESESSALNTLPIQTSFYDGDARVERSIFLQKGKAKKVIYQLELSDRLSTGDYLLLAGYETQPDQLSTTYSVRAKLRVMTPILLTVSKSGVVDIRGEIRSFETKNQQYFYDSFDPIPLNLVIANTGKNALRASGKITVRNAFGQSAQYDLAERLILSKTSGQLSLDQDGASGVTVKGFFVGKYTASAAIVITDGTVQLSRSTTFYSFPFKILFGGIFITISGLIVLRRRR